MSPESTAFGPAFIARSRTYLRGEYLTKIRRCIEALSEEDLWWRPNPACNSVGNLVLHLAGNLRQWVVSGIGGEPDVRDRPAEFEREGGLDADALVQRLSDAVDAADAVLARLEPASLHERRTIQSRDVTVLEALYHAVEHFSTHTGQILYITKLRTGADLGFYEIRDGVVRHTW